MAVDRNAEITIHYGCLRHSCINDNHNSQVLPELWLSVSWQICTRKANKLSFMSQELNKTQPWIIDFQITNYRKTEAYYYLFQITNLMHNSFIL